MLSLLDLLFFMKYMGNINRHVFGRSTVGSEPDSMGHKIGIRIFSALTNRLRHSSDD
jgi:hypothetical protein